MTPQQIAEAASAAMWASDGASRGLGMTLDSVGPGTATLSMPVRDDMVNGLDLCHGGFIFTLADSTFAFACNSYNQRAVAQIATITFIAPARRGDRLTATAREVASFGRSGVYDIRVTSQTGALIAEFRGHSRTIKGTHIPLQE
jgi:acyl-CoA thioesterase